jgi:kinesin family protein 5
LYRAKTVKNVVVVNEELSAEQWKRRYEKEHERVARLKGQLARAQNELERWRRGEQVSVDEQVNLKIDFLDNEPGLSSSASFLSLSSIPISLSSNALLNQTVTLSGNAADATFAVSVPSDWEKERMVLYAQLDEKDDELNNASQTIETLKMNLAEQDELIKQLRKENDDLQNRIGALETDNEMRKDELKEIMKAFEELAMNFDLKQQESDTTRSENETLLQELDKKAISLKQIENELDLYKDNMNSQRKRIFDMMFTLLKDLSEISGVVGGGAVTDFKVGFETITAFCFLHDLIKTICV